MTNVFIGDAVTLEDMSPPRGTAIIDAEGQVWQYGPPGFVAMWFPANGYRDIWLPSETKGGPKFPVRIIHIGDERREACR